jgi:hypothetical protein
MKKKSLFFWIMIIMISVCHSQERNRGAFEVIPIVGFTGSGLYGSDVAYSETRFGFKAGVIGDYYFNNRWSFRSGLEYFSMGAESPFIELKLDYLNIPLNANWHFGSTRKWNLNFGLSPGFLVRAEAEDRDLKEMFTTFQLAFSFGIGYKLEITQRFSILIDYQRVLGLTNILTDTDLSSTRNTADSINLGGVLVF